MKIYHLVKTDQCNNSKYIEAFNTKSDAKLAQKTFQSFDRIHKYSIVSRNIESDHVVPYYR